jgi:hypothetical protein
MTDKNDEKSPDNIFKVMDGVISQLNKTKKMFIIMILTVMILPPLSFVFTSAIIDPPFEHMQKPAHNGPPPFLSFKSIPFLISLVWLGIGIRQWFVLSGWTKKYSRYKELQKKLDKELDDDDEKKNN